MQTYKTLIIFLLLSVVAYSIGEDVIDPNDPQNQDLYLGKITQGQTFTISLNPIVTQGGIYNKGGRYDTAKAVNLPERWISKDASLYGNPLEVLITVPIDAKDEEVSFNVVLIDEKNQEKLETKTINARVTVTNDSMNVYSFINTNKVGVRSPLDVKINVENKVDFGNLFNVTIQSTTYSNEMTVYVPANSEREITYTISFEKEGIENINVSVVQSNKIYTQIHTVEVDQSLFSEYASIGQGVDRKSVV